MPVGFRSAVESFTGVSQNVGLGGMFVVTERPLTVGERCTVEFTLPDHIRPVSVDAEVRWVRETADRAVGAGLRFVNLPIGAMVALHELLRRFDLPA